MTRLLSTSPTPALPTSTTTAPPSPILQHAKAIRLERRRRRCRKVLMILPCLICCYPCCCFGGTCGGGGGRNGVNDDVDDDGEGNRTGEDDDDDDGCCCGGCHNIAGGDRQSSSSSKQRVTELSSSSKGKQVFGMTPPTATKKKKDLITNRDELLAKIRMHGGFELRNATDELKDDKDVVITAVTDSGLSLLHASDRLKSDKDIVTAAVKENGLSLRMANEALQADPEVVMAAVQQTGKALEYASNKLQSDPQIVRAAVTQDGLALQYASNELRSDKGIVMAAISCKPEALKYSLNGLNQDEDCWKAANLLHHEEGGSEGNVGGDIILGLKLWKRNHNTTKSNNNNNNAATKNPTQIVLSTKFSLSEESNSNATTFTVVLNQTKYFNDHDTHHRNFIVYSPNAFTKQTCDPSWTSIDWPCRGTIDTCRMMMMVNSKEEKNNPKQTSGTAAPTADTLLPTNSSCWRYSYRYHLQQAKKSGGFMIQVVDYDNTTKKHVLGDGQKIETIMANEVGIQVFRVCQPVDGVGLASDFTSHHMEELVSRIKEWYRNHDTANKTSNYRGGRNATMNSKKSIETATGGLNDNNLGIEIQHYYLYSPGNGWTPFNRTLQDADVDIPCLKPE